MEVFDDLGQARDEVADGGDPGEDATDEFGGGFRWVTVCEILRSRRDRECSGRLGGQGSHEG